MQGTIKKINNEKGFGFIRREGKGKDVFFHARYVDNEQFEVLEEGDLVIFEEEDGERGPRATRVHVLK